MYAYHRSGRVQVQGRKSTSEMSSTLAADIKLPLFVFPTSLNFYSDDSTSHQQLLTLYNPYNFSLKYKVLCTSPRKYRVVDADGTIKPRCCIDVYVKHRDANVSNEHVRDKFRLQVSQLGHNTVIGRKDILSIVLPTKEQQQQQQLQDYNTDDQFESLPAAASVTSSSASSSMLAVSAAQQSSTNIHLQTVSHRSAAAAAGAGPSWVVLLSAVLCIIILMLPLQSSTDDGADSDVTGSSTVSLLLLLLRYCVVTVHQKLIAAYILGLVTMVILRS